MSVPRREAEVATQELSARKLKVNLHEKEGDLEVLRKDIFARFHTHWDTDSICAFFPRTLVTCLKCCSGQIVIT